MVVYDKNEQDQMLKDVWNSMNNALLVGDVDKAVEHLSRVLVYDGIYAIIM